MHYTNKKKIIMISFPSSLQFPCRTKGEQYFVLPAEAEIILVGTVCQSEVFTFSPPALPQFLAQTQKHLPILLTEPEQIMDRCMRPC